MPKTSTLYCNSTVNGIAFGTTTYANMVGYRANNATEAATQLKVYDTLTGRNLYVRVPTNSVNAATTIRTRVNGVDGNLSVSVPASTTGTFEDTTNTDSLVSGNNYNYQIVTGGGAGTIFPNTKSVQLEHADTLTTYLACAGSRATAAGSTRNFVVVGRNIDVAAVASSQYRIRFSATWSRIRIYVSANATTAASTFRSFKNGVNGAQSVSIGAGLTGEFEDTTNSDTLVATDLINYRLAVGAGGALTHTLMQSRITTTSTDTMVGFAGDGNNVNWNSTGFMAYGGGMESFATETSVQALVRTTPQTVRNLFVYVVANARLNASTIESRKNSAPGNLSVSIPTLATGIFEDTTNSDSLALTDTSNFRVILGAGVEDLEPSIVAVSLDVGVGGFIIPGFMTEGPAPRVRSQGNIVQSPQNA